MVTYDDNDNTYDDEDDGGCDCDGGGGKCKEGDDDCEHGGGDDNNDDAFTPSTMSRLADQGFSSDYGLRRGLWIVRGLPCRDVLRDYACTAPLPRFASAQIAHFMSGSPVRALFPLPKYCC